MIYLTQENSLIDNICLLYTSLELLFQGNCYLKIVDK